MTIIFLIKKEFLQIIRNKFLVAAIIFLPIFELAILPWAATLEQTNTLICIIDSDKSKTSKQLIEKITASRYFIPCPQTHSYKEALEKFQQNSIAIILEIPRNFEYNLIHSQPAPVSITADAVDIQKAGLGIAYLSEIIANYNSELITTTENHTTNIFQLFPLYWYNNSMKYYNYMVPGILVILMTMIGGMLSAINIVREKEIGTIEQINVTPVSKLTFICGKLIPFWILGLINLSIGISIAWGIYNLLPAGSIIDIYVYAFFYLFAITGLGLVISNYANTQQQAMFVLTFLLITCIMLSGLFTPISSMPSWMQSITLANPLRYFVEVIRLIYLKGSSLSNVRPQVIAIICIGIFFNIWAILSYKKSEV